jgi:hypothetical protein
VTDHLTLNDPNTFSKKNDNPSINKPIKNEIDYDSLKRSSIPFGMNTSKLTFQQMKYDSGKSSPFNASP